jgi:hypothetical protein
MPVALQDKFIMEILIAAEAILTDVSVELILGT